MANDADLVWNEFYKYCLEKIGKDDKTVEMYLQTCMPVSLANGVLLVDVATPFAMEQIRNRYMDRMQKLIAETGFASELRFSVSENHEGKEEKIPSRVSQPQHEPEQPPKRTASKNGLNPNYVFSTFEPGRRRIARKHIQPVLYMGKGRTRKDAPDARDRPPYRRRKPEN